MSWSKISEGKAFMSEMSGGEMSCPKSLGAKRSGPKRLSPKSLGAKALPEPSIHDCETSSTIVTLPIVRFFYYYH